MFMTVNKYDKKRILHISSDSQLVFVIQHTIHSYSYSMVRVYYRISIQLTSVKNIEIPLLYIDFRFVSDPYGISLRFLYGIALYSV